MDINTKIAIISAIVAVVSTLTSIYYNSKNQKQYLKSLEPALSFKLFKHKGTLFLQIANTGQSPAVNIRVVVKEIKNNGSRNELELDKLFDNDFDLYPNEVTQGMVAYWGANIVEHAFPSVSVYVEYNDKITNKEVVYNRTIIYNPSFGETVHAKVDMDLKDIRDDINTMARANLRTANYLDGCKLSYIDRLDVISGNSLHDDLIDVVKGNEDSNIWTRQEVIKGVARSRKK